jgi:hypothetical protein
MFFPASHFPYPSTMNSLHSSFSHDLSPPPPSIFHHFSVLIHFPSSLSFFALHLFLSLHLYPYLSIFIPFTVSIPLVFPFIPHTSPILFLTFSHFPSSIRSSHTLYHYSLILFSSSLIHHPLPLSLSPNPSLSYAPLNTHPSPICPHTFDLVLPSPYLIPLTSFL